MFLDLIKNLSRDSSLLNGLSSLEINHIIHMISVRTVQDSYNLSDTCNPYISEFECNDNYDDAVIKFHYKLVEDWENPCSYYQSAFNNIIKYLSDKNIDGIRIEPMIYRAIMDKNVALLKVCFTLTDLFYVNKSITTRDFLPIIEYRVDDMNDLTNELIFIDSPEKMSSPRRYSTYSGENLFYKFAVKYRRVFSDEDILIIEILLANYCPIGKIDCSDSRIRDLLIEYRVRQEDLTDYYRSKDSLEDLSKLHELKMLKIENYVWGIHDDINIYKFLILNNYIGIDACKSSLSMLIECKCLDKFDVVLRKYPELNKVVLKKKIDIETYNKLNNYQVDIKMYEIPSDDSDYDISCGGILALAQYGSQDLMLMSVDFDNCTIRDFNISTDLIVCN